MSYTEALSIELRGTGVTTTVLAPGWVHTEFHDRGGANKSSIPGFLWLDPKRLVASAIRDADRGKVVSLSSARYSVLIWIIRRLPQSTTRWLARQISSTRSESQRKTVGAL
jgi:short-subunit dehydrogenase